MSKVDRPLTPARHVYDRVECGVVDERRGGAEGKQLRPQRTRPLIVPAHTSDGSRCRFMRTKAGRQQCDSDYRGLIMSGH